jgi:hypothetical protein
MIARALGGYAWMRFRAACRDPLAAQAARLRQILRDAARTEFGREHDFRALSRITAPAAIIRAYQEHVPVRDYRAMQEDLDAVYQGHWQRLCPDPPLWFAMTAGSTGRYKYIPVTRQYRREVGRSSLIFQGALHASFPAVRGSRTQFLVGSAEGGFSPAGVPQGFASGFNYRNLPRLLRRQFVVPYWVFTLDDAEERAYAAGRILVDEPRLAVLCAISPVNLINLRRALDRNAERLVRDVERGTLSVRSRSAVPGSWRGTPSPDRARTLRRALHANGSLPGAELFPGLRVLVCWQGGNMSYHVDELRSVFGVADTFEFPISASEGVFAIPFRAGQAGGVLAVSSHVLEFIADDTPRCNVATPQGAGVTPRGAGVARRGTGVAVPGAGVALRADELEAGREYRLVVTNAGGLYRYDMEDIVRVTGRFQATPVIEFVSKASRQVSVSNERLTEQDVTRAMLEASRRCGCWFDEFLFVPCTDRRYRVVLDGAGSACRRDPQRDALLRRFAAELERQVRRCSSGYDFERDDALLLPLQLLVTAPGQLQGYLLDQQPGQQLPNAQVKPVHLTSRFNAHERFTAEATYAA